MRIDFELSFSIFHSASVGDLRSQLYIPVNMISTDRITVVVSIHFVMAGEWVDKFDEHIYNVLRL